MTPRPPQDHPKTVPNRGPQTNQNRHRKKGGNKNYKKLGFLHLLASEVQNATPEKLLGVYPVTFLGWIRNPKPFATPLPYTHMIPEAQIICFLGLPTGLPEFETTP